MGGKTWGDHPENTCAHASPVPKMGALTSPDFNPILPPQ